MKTRLFYFCLTKPSTFPFWLVKVIFLLLVGGSQCGLWRVMPFLSSQNGMQPRMVWDSSLSRDGRAGVASATGQGASMGIPLTSRLSYWHSGPGDWVSTLWLYSSCLLKTISFPGKPPFFQPGILTMMAMAGDDVLSFNLRSGSVSLWAFACRRNGTEL